MRLCTAPGLIFTADDGQVDLKVRSYLAIGTLESYENMKRYFGEENVCPIYVEVEDGERLKRALAREELQEKPRYAEMCRRFLAEHRRFLGGEPGKSGNQKAASERGAGKLYGRNPGVYPQPERLISIPGTGQRLFVQ